MKLNDIKAFGDIARLDHIGIAVNSIKSVSPSSEIITEHIQKVKVAFIMINGIKIELIEPHGNDSPVKESTKKNIKFLHVCYAIPNIDKALIECRQYGFHCISKPVPAVAFGGSRIAWVYNKAYGLFELLEDASLNP